MRHCAARSLLGEGIVKLLFPWGSVVSEAGCIGQDSGCFGHGFSLHFFTRLAGVGFAALAKPLLHFFCLQLCEGCSNMNKHGVELFAFHGVGLAASASPNVTLFRTR